MAPKKSQLHMMETIIILALFFILIIMGYAFYLNVTGDSIDDEIWEGSSLNAAKIAQRASSLPEMQCSQKNVVASNCIDTLKLEPALESIKNPENEAYYFGIFSFSRITVYEAYPNPKELSTVYDRQMKDYSSKIATNIPVSIFYPLENKYAFGIINVEAYSR